MGLKQGGKFGKISTPDSGSQKYFEIPFILTCLVLLLIAAYKDTWPWNTEATAPKVGNEARGIHSPISRFSTGSITPKMLRTSAHGSVHI